MAFSLSDLLQAVNLEVGELIPFLATGGSTTTAVDSTQTLDDGPDDDELKNGTLFVIGGDPSVTPSDPPRSPIGEFQRISGNANSSGTFTVDTAFSTAISARDTIGYASNIFPLRTLIELANAALRNLGDIVLVDTTTLDTASSQTEYTWQVAWKRRRPMRIDIQGRTDDANDNRWVQVENFEVIPATAGGTGLIVFDFQPVESRDVRVWYTDEHPRLSTAADVIHESIPPELAVAATIERVRKWEWAQNPDEPFIVERLNDARVELDRVKILHEIWQHEVEPGGLVVSDNFRFQTDLFKDVADIP